MISEDGSFFLCCPGGQPVSGSDITAVHCAGIRIEPDDPFWKNRECLSFVRTQSAPALDCQPGPTQQVLRNSFLRNHFTMLEKASSHFPPLSNPECNYGLIDSPITTAY
jgi:hypothetical protein